MHPGMYSFWQHARRACGKAATACGTQAPEWAEGFQASGDGDFDGGGYGVRRPLRFLAYKLELRESQVGELARILNHLKTERAQAAVDYRRTTAALADALAGESF